MIKGKSTIQLFDAVTGEETLRASDTNMVTGAVGNLLNPPVSWGVCGTCGNLQAAANLATPIATNAMGGILLWQDGIVEDAANILPPCTNTLVGRAGGDYSGTDVSRGCYNEAESGPISGGWRNVWDFSTDRANGYISCITLTSRGGGNTGWLPATDGSGVFSTPWNFYADNTGTQSFHISPVSSRGSVTDTFWDKTLTLGRVCANRYVILNAGTLFLVETVNAGSIDLDDACNGTGSATRIIASHTLADHWSLNNVFLKNSTTYGIVKSITSSAMTLELYNIETGELTETVALLSSGFSFYSEQQSVYVIRRIVFHGGKYFVIASTAAGVYKVLSFDSEGGFLAELSAGLGVTALDSCSLFVFNGVLFFKRYTLPSNASAFSYYFNENDGCFLPYLHGIDGALPNIPITDFAAPTYPYVICSRFNNSSTSFDATVSDTEIAIFRPYLATINNLASPITKTNAHTMKITYDLYQE